MWKYLLHNNILILLIVYGGFILLRKHQKPEASLFKDNISEIETITEIFKDRNYYDRKTKHLNRVALAIISGAGSAAKYKNKSYIVSDVKKSTFIFYNRVNKCGSTSMLELIGDLGFSNNFTVVGRGLPKLRSLKEKDKKRLGLFLCDESLPRMVFTRHLYYVNYSNYGCDIQYYNMVRDPVERFISRYYFHRKNFLNLRGRLETMDSIIPFFCGDTLECRTLGSKEALRRAKINIKEKFVAVGVLEFLEKSLAVLECKLPQYFKGIRELQRSRRHHLNKNYKKIAVSGEVREILRRRLRNEYKLYNFITKQLTAQIIQCDVS